MGVITFNAIKPIIDKVVYTIRLNTYEYNYLRELFDDHFGNGLPRKVGNQFGYIYKGYNIWISKHNKFKWSRIQFYPETVSVDEIVGILSNFTVKLYTSLGKSYTYQNLKSLEVAFDLELPDDWNDIHEKVAELISNNLRCEVQKRGFCRTYSGDENKNTSDGAVNGISSHYIVSAKNRTLSTFLQPKINNDGCSSIVYCKYLPQEGGEMEVYDNNDEEYNWNIRFEVRLNSARIKRDIKDLGFVLPYDLGSIFEFYKNKKFKDYYSFAEVDFEKFLEKANEKVDNSTRPAYKTLCRLGKDKSVSCKLFQMKSITKLLHSKSLYNHIYDYIRSLSFKKFKKKLYKKVDSLLNKLK